MRVAVLVVACGVWGVGAARADNKADATAVFEEGSALYDAGAYDEAAAKFRAAHAIDPDPVYLFNAGQALRFAKRCDDAVTYYQRFLAEVPGAKNRSAVEGYLAEVRACATPVPPPPPPPPPPLPPRAKSSGLRIAGVAVGVAGVAMLGAGVYFSSDARSQARRIDALCVPAAPGELCPWSDALQEEERALIAKGERADRNAILSYAIGGAAVITGALLYLRAPARREPKVTVAPIGGGGMIAATAFAF